MYFFQFKRMMKEINKKYGTTGYKLLVKRGDKEESAGEYFQNKNKSVITIFFNPMKESQKTISRKLGREVSVHTLATVTFLHELGHFFDEDIKKNNHIRLFLRMSLDMAKSDKNWKRVKELNKEIQEMTYEAEETAWKIAENMLTSDIDKELFELYKEEGLKSYREGFEYDEKVIDLLILKEKIERMNNLLFQTNEQTEETKIMIQEIFKQKEEFRQGMEEIDKYLERKEIA